MKQLFYFCLLTILFLFNACKKKDKHTSESPLPQISTTPIANITKNSAMSGGNVSSEGTSAITAVGICWDPNPNPTTLKLHTNEGAGTGSYESTITGLTLNTTYYLRAYATNGNGTSYGDELVFKTLSEPCDTVTYTKYIKPLIDTYCISCHGTSPNPGAPLLTTYAYVKTVADNGTLKKTTLDPSPTPELMPVGGPPLSQAEKDLIQCWLINGKIQ